MATLFNCTETSYESNRGQNVSLSPWKLWKPFALFCGECIAAKSFDSVNFSEKNFKFAMLIIKFYHINEDHRRKKKFRLARDSNPWPQPCSGVFRLSQAQFNKLNDTSSTVESHVYHHFLCKITGLQSI